MGYDIPLRHSAELKVTTARFLVLEMCRRFRSFSWDRRPQPGWKQPATPWERDAARCKPSEKIDVVPIEPHTMFLGIHGGKLCLACVKSGDEIKLKLEAVNITDLNQNREQDKRFAFIRFDNGPTTSFESAACPGWFLCTSLEADQPVGLTNMPTEALKVTKFYFQQD
uniref:Interleukin-1 n=2 Tax=Bos TaxID=9903 RepID=A0A452DJS3_BOVIN